MTFGTPRGARLALVVALSLAAPRGAGAVTDQEKAAARELAEKGDRAYRAGQYAEAQGLFARAAALLPAPTVLLFLARSSAQLGRLVQAREAYRAILRQELAPEAPPAFRAAQENAKRELDDIERRVPRVTVSVRGAEGSPYRVLIDGVETSPALIDVALPIDPGQHVFEVVGERMDRATVTRTIASGSQVTVVLAVQPNATPAPAVTSSGDAGHGGAQATRTLAFVSLGVGALGLGLGTVMGVRHFSKRSESSELFDACNPQFCDDDEQQKIDELDRAASTAGTLAIVGFAAGAVGLGTGLYFLLRPPGDAPPSVGLRLGPGGGSVVGRF